MARIGKLLGSLALTANLSMCAAGFSQDTVPDTISQIPSPALPAAGALSREQISELKKAVSDIRMKETSLAEKQKEFNDYFNLIVFPPWLAPDKVANFAKERIDFKASKLYSLREVPDAHEALNRLTQKTMGDIVGGQNYHPVARFNAMLLIGELDEVEPVGKVPGVPFKEAQKEFLRVMSLDARLAPDYIKIAAMQGLLRHAQAHVVTGADAGNAVNLLLPIAAAAKPPAGRSLDGQVWMRRRAVQIIGAIGLSGGAVTSELQKIVKDTSAPFNLRCDAAMALGELEYKELPQAKAAELGKDVGLLALDATRREVKETEISLPQLKTRLHAVKVALAGPDEPAATGGRGIPGANADATLKVIVDMMAAIDAKSPDAGSLSRQADALAATLGVAAGPAMPAPNVPAKPPTAAPATGPGKAAAKAPNLDEFGAPGK